MSLSEMLGRRLLISGSAAVAAGALLVRGSEGLPAGVFALDVASGDPLPEGAALWTRLTGLSEV
jgi:alkaline phosphatase D